MSEATPSQQSAEASLVGQSVGPYRLESLLGSGGMGAVYLAYDRRLDRRVALKQILPEAMFDRRHRQRFLREARAVARLNHPAIVQIFDLLEAEGSDWIVMELAAGETLADRLAEGSFSVEEGLSLALQLAEGLAAAHDEGIVHRDLKARNVIVTPKGQAKILDFGLAKILAPSSGEGPKGEVSSRTGRGGDQSSVEDPSITVTGRVIGTPQAMSPEQAMGLDTDHRSDLFSLGSLLYQLFTGVAPFGTATTVATLARVCTHRQTPPHELDPAIPRVLSALIDRLLEKEPEDRPANTHEVIRDLARLARPSGDTESRRRAGKGLFPASAGQSGTETIGGKGSGVEGRSRSEAGRSSSELRQVTVMSCELAHARGGAGSLDPEVLFEVMGDYQELALEVVGRLGGYMVNTLAHRLVITFGYPRAQGDDAARAVRAGFALKRAVEALPPRGVAWPEGGLSLRIGLNTGPVVVVASPEREEQLALGKTLELAAGIERQVSESGVWVSPVTYELIEEWADVEPQVRIALPGFENGLQARRVTSLREPGELEPSAPSRPLVGRDHELDLLRDRWRLARGGAGQIVLVSGEAGIGKSRLILDLIRHLADESVPCLVAYASSHASGSPMRPVAAMLRQALALGAEESSENQLSGLESGLEALGLPPPELVPLLAPMLALSLDGRHPLPPMSPGKLRGERMEAVLSVLEELAEREPFALVIEDLHWLDPSSLELIGLLLDRVAALPLLLVLTARPTFQAPWGFRSGINQLTLERLADDQVESLIAELVGERDLPRSIRDRIIARGDGVPLFVEELTRMLLASGPPDGIGEAPGRSGVALSLSDRSPVDIPATLRESLTARLDQMGRAKQVAQLASVIGREFSRAMLAALPSSREHPVDVALDRLVEGELVQRRGVGPRARFLFKHSLVQDAAYESLLQARRREIHGEVADTLVAEFPHVVDKQPELLAHHYTQADRLRPAIARWQEAGQRAARSSALVEARNHLEHGLELAARLPDGAAKDRLELDLLASLGPVASALEGFASGDVGRIYRRAVERLDRLGVERTGLEDLSAIGIEGSGMTTVDATGPQPRIADPELFWISWGLWTFYLMRGDLEEADELAGRLLERAELQDDVSVLMEALYARGFTRWALGEPLLARRALARGLALDGEGRDRSRTFLTGRDVGVTTRSILGLVLWQLGHPDQALGLCRRAVALAREIDHPFSLTTALTVAADVHLLCGNRSALRRAAGEVVEIAERLGFVHAAAQGRGLLGWAMAGDGEGAEEGLGVLRLSLEQSRAAGARFSETLALSFLAQAWLREGRGDEARRALEEALDTVRETGECLWEAELYRLRGEVARCEGLRDEAGADFERALELAHRQGSRSLELRAVISLSRWREEAREESAASLLRPIIESFDEGHDTTDLEEAGALLASISARG